MNPESTKEMKNEVAISEAVPEDAKDIARIQHETWLATYVRDDGGVTAEDVESKNFKSEERVEQWKGYIASDASTIFVARHEGSVAGYCGLYMADGTQAIRAIYVLPEAQGKGIGKKLLHEALTHADEEKPVELSVAAFNEQAIAFYESLGFEQCGPNKDPHVKPFPSGKTIEEILMVKEPNK